MDQNRWKSPVLWTAIGSQVVAILLLTGVIGSEQAEYVNNILAALLQVAVAIGIVNNPASTEW